MIFHPSLMPARVIADPELTVSLPPFLTAATGMDAFTHCLESLTAPIFHPICDAIAVGGLELVVRYLERATKNGSDIEARAQHDGRGHDGRDGLSEGPRRGAFAGASAFDRVRDASRPCECRRPARRHAL
jgi:hypothetical protein